MRARRWIATFFVFFLVPLVHGDPIARVGAVGMTISNMERSLAFYSDVLTFEKVSDHESWGEEVERRTGVFGARVRVVRMRLGDEEIELTEYLTPKGRPIPPDSRSNDRWFQHVAIIVSDMEAAYEVLRRHRVQHASPAPQRLPDWNPNAGGIEAFYFRDPDGKHLEILAFPPDKGDPEWRRRKERGELFLGIDHTAIVVEDTERSLAFYRDRLGLRVAGESLNHGPEQERLNNLFGARLRITALRAPEGPGIELLEYLTPRDGRPMPDDERPNDLVHWQTHLTGGDAGALAGELLAARARFLTFGEIEFLVRDPDGHVLLVLEESIRP